MGREFKDNQRISHPTTGLEIKAKKKIVLPLDTNFRF